MAGWQLKQRFGRWLVDSLGAPIRHDYASGNPRLRNLLAAGLYSGVAHPRGISYLGARAREDCVSTVTRRAR